MRKKYLCRRSLALLLGMVLTISGALVGCSGDDKEEESTKPQQEDKQEQELPKLDDWSNVSVKSSGNREGNAVLMDDGISIVYDEELKTNVLKLDGDTGYLELPKEFFAKVGDGFSISLKIKADEGAGDNVNLFQTNLCGYGVGDTYWRDAPEISLTKGGSLRVFVGGRTINGTYSATATYNNGGTGDDKNYAEPGGHKTRYAAEAKGLEAGAWNDVVLSVSKDDVAVYYNGSKADLAEDTTLQGDIKSTLEYLFGNYDGGENILAQYIYSSIGNSVYNDTPGFKGLVSEIRMYEKTLSAEEAAKLPDGAAYVWDFDTQDLVYAGDNEEQIDLTKYMGSTALTEVEEAKTVSPDGKNVVQLWKDEAGSFYYSIKAGDTVIVESSAIGMSMEEGELSSGLELAAGSVEKQEIKETYSTITGPRDEETNHCNETKVTLQNAAGSFDFIIRAYDDGVAYRYAGVSVAEGDAVTVKDELSEYILPKKATTWSFALNATYEGEYVRRTGSQLEALASTLSTPMLANVGDYWVLLTEASVFNNNGDFCASALQTTAGSRTLGWTFGMDRDPNHESTGELDSPGHINITKVETRNGFATPWRVAVFSDDLETYSTSSIISDLNPAADEELFANTDWIKPGKVAWSWWSEDAEQNNYDKHIEYIDFAAENGWEYVCLDAYWRAFEDRLGEMCQYAKEKGVGLFVWVNYRDIKDYAQMDELFGKWKEAGVAGLKTDYFESDAQNVLNVMEEAAKCSAKHELMILYHGCVRPGGEYRTYPNILSTEAVQGEEWHKWFAYPTIENCLLYPFSRNICGSMDYTPVATKVGSNDSTYGFGLAMTVVYESGLQHLAYAASSYKSYNGLSFLNHLVTDWNESKLVEGEPGKYVTYARRHGEDWYIGSMTAEERAVSVKLDFLGDGEYNAYIYKDNEDGTQLIIEQKKVTKADTFSIDLLAGGGVAVLITKDTVDTTVGESEEMNNPDYTYYEAESRNNTLAGAAVYQSSAFCSGSQKVGYVGNGAANTLTFNKVTVEKDGTYKMLLYYCCGENRKVDILVNGDKTYELTGLNSGDYVHTAVAEIEIELKAGENTIQLSNASAFAPDIDRIGVSKSAQ